MTTAVSTVPAKPGAQQGPLDDFSIVLGGPLYQIYLRTRLARPGLELLKRRLVGITALAFVPLVIFATLEGRAFGGTPVPLLRDVEVYARILCAIPLMILAEFIAHRRVAGIVRQFVDRGIVTPEDMPRFEAIKASAVRLRNSVTAEVVQLVLAVGIHWVWGRALLLKEESWMGGAERYTVAGWWYAFVSLAIFRFMLFRWYYRTFLWYRVLWQTARMNLRLDALHPDRCAGLGFLANAPAVFSPLLLAHSFLLTGLVQNKIWYEGKTLADFKFEIAIVAVFALLLAITPLFFFLPKLVAAKRKGNAEYGALASRYIAAFREKWLGRAASQREELVGSADIQSLADLSGAYDAVRETRAAPVTRQTIMQLVVVIAIPLLPLALNVIPYDQVLMRLAGFIL